MRKALEAIYFIFWILKINKIFYFINRKKQIILTYHNVIPDNMFDGKPHLGVSHRESSFKKQIDIISKHKKITCKLNEENTVVITFDDGYNNNYFCSKQYLDSSGSKAIFFIPTQHFSCDKILDIDKILLWISYAPVGKHSLLADEFTLVDRCSDFERLYATLLESWKKVKILLSQMNESYPFEALDIDKQLYVLRFKPLSKNQITEMSRNGHIIAAHSHTHAPLKILSDSELSDEFSKSREYHVNLNNKSLFSYPFGGENEVSLRETEVCKKFGYQYAFLNVEQPPFEGADTRYTIGRTSLPDTAKAWIIHAKLSGLEKSMKKILAKLN